MVAMAVSLLLLAGIITLFANSRNTYETNDRLARIQENGRFALELLARDIRSAGYVGCAKRTPTKPLQNLLNSNTSLLWNFAVPVQGFQANSSSWNPSLVTPLTATDIPDRDGAGPDTDGIAAGSDVLVVRGPIPDRTAQRLQVDLVTGSDNISARRAVGTPMATGDLAMIASCDQASVFQVTGYTTGSGAAPDVIVHANSGSPGNSTASFGPDFFNNTAEVYPIRTAIYFLDTGSLGNGTSLYRLVANTGATQLEELVEGIDSMQLTYGVDTNGDWLVDSYVAANSVTNWDQVKSVRIALLVRSLEEYGNSVDNDSRTLLGDTVAAFGDRRQRLVFTITATIRNRTF
jgi:type IV pilus assembly protein PilW